MPKATLLVVLLMKDCFQIITLKGNKSKYVVVKQIKIFLSFIREFERDDDKGPYFSAPKE